MIDIVDQALDAFPAIDPTLYVDDLSAEVAGHDDFVAANLVGFLNAAVSYTHLTLPTKRIV